MITLPFLGRVVAGGKRTLAQFQEDLAKLLSSGYIKNPQVRVDVDTYKSQVVFRHGRRAHARPIQMTGAVDA